MKDGNYNWQLMFYLPDKNRFRLYDPMLSELINKCIYHIDKFNSKYFSKIILPNGYYRFNMRDECDFLFTKIEGLL